MEKPLVTIIIPCKNSERTIRRCLDSILSQSYDNWECLVVDDHGTDNTYEIIDVNYNDDRIKYLLNRRYGIGAARNIGIQHSRGEFIVFVDADDFLPKDSLEIRVAHVVKDNNAGACFSSKLFSEHGTCDEMPTGYIKDSEKFLSRMSLFEAGVKSGLEYVWDKIFRRSIIDEFGIRFDERYESYEDRIFVLDYVSKCIGDFGFYDYSVYYYVKSETGNSISDVYRIGEFYTIKSIYHRYLAEVSYSMHNDCSCLEGCVHFLINKIVRMLYMASFVGKTEEIYRLCEMVIADVEIQQAANIYKSKNEIERLDIVNLINGKDAKSLYEYLRKSE